MQMIQERLEEKKYLLDQEAKAEQIEVESLDIMIRRLENQLKNEKELNFIKKEEKVHKNTSQQTENPKVKEIGTFTLT